MANPYTYFLLEGFEKRVQMQDEWHNWRGNPRISHQFGEERNDQVKNRIMLTALNENIFNSAEPNYGDQHYTAWTYYG